ncbi:hypothetical protein [Lewinella sp. W8]|uniref:hypothetical protein n=1 Tax=Lewinella sp. W8 TaxID=2528208 RepID=UPI0010675FA2|nr:hypothetical protein [Lewinella sp. W8]MTB52679.1 hypothetical protein [Lewinella sp. W8]
MQTYLYSILRSFSVQLLLLHLRSNFLLLCVWIIVATMMGGWLGSSLGLQYLFLDPEYLNRTDFWAFLIVGAAFGFFTMSWNLSTYLLVGGYFNFLASLSRPFFKFCINNALLPLVVFFTYCGLLFRFYGPAYGNRPEWSTFLEALSGLILGLIISLFLYAIYFNLTNRDISYYHRRHREPPPNMGPNQRQSSTPGYRPYRASPLAPLLSGIYDNPYGVQTYLNEKLKTRLVRSVAHYESNLLRGIFRQNHLNAIFLQLASVLTLALLGLLIDQPLFQVPAGASILIFMSLVISTIGAISYWFSEWRVTLLIVILFGVNFITSTPWLEHGNQAYGLRYDTLSPYSAERLMELYASDQVETDKAHTIQILENWKAKQESDRPPLVIIAASGGGLTSALWTTHIAQAIEGCSEGKLLRSTALMTGASGGQIGLAYLREAYLQDPEFSRNANDRLQRISRDLLNPIAFSIVSNDLFLPFTRVRIGDQYYRRDRAYSFERELAHNTGYFREKVLADYREPEASAAIPMMFLTPSIVDDGRRMVISPQGVSYMTAPPPAIEQDINLKPDMVDFRWLFAPQEADSLRFLSALRMNATYPYVLPLVKLPSRPALRIMDAGYRDNYGIASASRFLTTFQDWIKENTSRVIIVQISAFREQDLSREAMANKKDDHPGVVENLFSPVGVAGNILSLQILDQEGSLAALSEIFGPDHFKLFRFNYQPPLDDPLRTSVSFHLTRREQQQILRKIDAPQIQRDIDALIQLLR